MENLDKKNDQFGKLMADSVTFSYVDGDITPIPSGHIVPWRCMPTLNLSYIEGYNVLLHLHDDQVIRVKSGETLCISPWVKHKITTEKVHKGVSHWSHTSFYILEGVDVFSYLDTPWMIRGETARRIGLINKELKKTTSLNATHWAQLLRQKSLGLELLALVVENSTPKHENSHVSEQFHQLSPSLEYLAEHFKEPIYHESLAKLCHLSISRYHTVFKEFTGMSPGKYLQNMRLRKAQSLLLKGELSVKMAAFEVGYPDEFHFSRQFQKRFGCSPSKIRLLAQSNSM